MPPELGNLANLRSLILSNNYLSGPIPPELGNLANLEILILSNNEFSGPIPAALGNLANLRALDLHREGMGPGRNYFSGPIPSELGNLAQLRVLIINLISPLPTSLSALGELRALFLLPGHLDRGASVLDLSSLPSNCHYIKWVGGELSDIVLWSACTKGTGCVVDLLGALYESRLSRQTRRQVCLNKASVLVSGVSLQLGLANHTGQHGESVTSVYMSNLYGTYFFNSTSFLDDIYSGPRGKAYTGVGFTRVQASNLCGNPEAERVIAVAYGTFVVSLFLTTLIVVVVGRWRRRIRGSGFNVQRKRPGRVQVLALYAWRVLMAVVPIVDIVTDSLVLNAVWGAWPMWIALLSIAAPFVAAAFAVAHFWASMGWRMVRCWDVDVRWIWRPYLRNMALVAPDCLDNWSTLVAIMVAPVALLGVIIQDLLTVLDDSGLRLVINGQLVSFEGYHNARILMELLLESVPQAAFQTALYALGSSRATRIYIDEQIFVQSISFALFNVFLQYSDMLWESVHEGRSFHAIVSGRLRSGRPVLIEQSEEESGANEKIVGSDDLGL